MTKTTALQQRLTIKANMTVDYVKQYGNAAQKAAICIFDEDGNGIFNSFEADRFNSTRLTIFGNNLRINKAIKSNGENPLIESVDLKKAQEEYVLKQKASEIKKNVVKYESRESNFSGRQDYFGVDKNGNVIYFELCTKDGTRTIARNFDKAGNITERVVINPDNHAYTY